MKRRQFLWSVAAAGAIAMAGSARAGGESILVYKDPNCGCCQAWADAMKAAGFSVKTGFAPYRVISRTVTKHGSDVRYRFVIDCLGSRCVGAPGIEREIRLPPATIGLPDGKSFVGYWPPLRQASRLAPGDLAHPELRGSLVEPDRLPAHDHRTLVGILLGAAAAICASIAFSSSKTRPILDATA